jgi:hypothetical protein
MAPANHFEFEKELLSTGLVERRLTLATLRLLYCLAMQLQLSPKDMSIAMIGHLGNMRRTTHEDDEERFVIGKNSKNIMYCLSHPQFLSVGESC